MAYLSADGTHVRHDGRNCCPRCRSRSLACPGRARRYPFSWGGRSAIQAVGRYVRRRDRSAIAIHSVEGLERMIVELCCHFVPSNEQYGEARDGDEDASQQQQFNAHFRSSPDPCFSRRFFDRLEHPIWSKPRPNISWDLPGSARLPSRPATAWMRVSATGTGGWRRGRWRCDRTEFERARIGAAAEKGEARPPAARTFARSVGRCFRPRAGG